MIAYGLCGLLAGFSGLLLAGRTNSGFPNAGLGQELDAISVATTNHWHSLITIWACQAEKDVYVEKPISHNVFEGRKCVEAAKKYNRVVQHGTQSRSSLNFARAVAAQDLNRVITQIGPGKVRYSIAVYVGRLQTSRVTGLEGQFGEKAAFAVIEVNLDLAVGGVGDGDAVHTDLIEVTGHD